MMHAVMSAPKRQVSAVRSGSRMLAVAMACGLLVLGACDPRGGSIDSMVKRAQEHRAAGSIRASVIELKNALQKDTQNANIRMLLGEAFIDLGDSNSADIELRRAKELGAPAARTALLLGETKLLQGRFDLALRETPVNDADPADVKAAVLALRGRAHLGLGQRVQAEQAFKAALEADRNGSIPCSASRAWRTGRTTRPPAPTIWRAPQRPRQRTSRSWQCRVIWRFRQRISPLLRAFSARS